VKQRSGPGVRDDALRDPRDMAKLRLPEAQSPEDTTHGPPERRRNVPQPASTSWQGRYNLQDCGAMSNEDIQGDEWDA